MKRSSRNASNTMKNEAANVQMRKGELHEEKINETKANAWARERSSSNRNERKRRGKIIDDVLAPLIREFSSFILSMRLYAISHWSVHRTGFLMTDHRTRTIRMKSKLFASALTWPGWPRSRVASWRVEKPQPRVENRFFCLFNQF